MARAHQVFQASEARDLFYRLSTWLMDRALAGEPPFSKTEALSVLLQTWNRGYYQRQRKPFDEAHISAIDSLLERHATALGAFRARSIETASNADEDIVRGIFSEFESVLGPTGSSKALHMLAPRFFPLWDTTIAERAYRLHRRDAADYWKLVVYTREQALAVGGELGLGRNPVKAIDEYNYCRYTLGLLG